MKYLILIRHGSYDWDTESLNTEGREEMAKMSKALKAIVNGSSAEIVSSPVLRAFQSAQILGRNLNLRPTDNDSLAFTEDELSERDKDQIMEIVTTAHVNTVILITHDPLISVIAILFGERVLKVDLLSQMQKLDSPGRGEGLIIDCELKTISSLP